MTVPIKEILQSIAEKRDEMIELQRLLTAVPAVSPVSGGTGEMAKARVLARWLEENGFPKPDWYYAPDENAEGERRPSLVVTIPAENEGPALWIMSHLDIVPPGEASLWNTDPYTLTVMDDRIIGRGVEDNQQGLVCSIFAAKAFLDRGIKPPNPVKLLFVADEENGSTYGIQYLLETEDLFGPDDHILVPDGGDPDGRTLEIAEKSTLWLKFHIFGKQGHGSRPDQGANAFKAGCALVCMLSDLTKVYPQKNDLFEPPVSTFEPTKKEANVPNINTLPGEDIFYLDSRILPEIPVDDVLATMDRLQKDVEDRYRVRISRIIVQRTESKATPSDCPLVRDLKAILANEYGVEAVPIGIGGGTVGAYLRNRGLDTVVWSKIDETAHMPNEYCKIENMIGDARVMASLMATERS